MHHTYVLTCVASRAVAPRHRDVDRLAFDEYKTPTPRLSVGTKQNPWVSVQPAANNDDAMTATGLLNVGMILCNLTYGEDNVFLCGCTPLRR